LRTSRRFRRVFGRAILYKSVQIQNVLKTPAVLSNLCFFHKRLRGRGDHKGVIGPSFILIGPAFFNTPRDDSKTSLQVQHSHKSYKSTEIDAQQTQQHQLKQNYPIIKSHLVQPTGTSSDTHIPPHLLTLRQTPFFPT
jgi:hypothetical protein